MRAIFTWINRSNIALVTLPTNPEPPLLALTIHHKTTYRYRMPVGLGRTD
jgi:hypothetical protein